MRTFGRPLWRVLRIPLVAYLLVLLLMLWSENSLIFFPSLYPQGDWAPRFLQFEEAEFRADDGPKLHGWYVPHPAPRAIVLFAHGNGGNLSHRAALVAEMVDRLRVSVMIFDYRGYGRSEGTPDEAGILADARAARRWLTERASVAQSDIVLFGESIGGAVAIDLAAREGARGLIVEGAFNSLPDVAAFHYPWLPVRWLMRTRLNSEAKIRSYSGPFLQIHGDADQIVPIHLAERLFAAANEPKTFLVIPGGDHNDPPTPAMFTAMEEFVSRLEARSRGLHPGGPPAPASAGSE